MVVMIAFNGWLGLLSAVTILFSALFSAESSSSSGISTECYEGTYADGRCNANNNRAECGTSYLICGPFCTPATLACSSRPLCRTSLPPLSSHSVQTEASLPTSKYTSELC